MTIDDSQGGVADNKQSLFEAAYEDRLYSLGIYHAVTMIGFVLYDYDETFPGWSISRFTIGKQFQGKGYDKQAVMEFLSILRPSIMQTSCISVCLWKIRLHTKCILLSSMHFRQAL